VGAFGLAAGFAAAAPRFASAGDVQSLGLGYRLCVCLLLWLVLLPQPVAERLQPALGIERSWRSRAAQPAGGAEQTGQATAVQERRAGEGSATLAIAFGTGLLIGLAAQLALAVADAAALLLEPLLGVEPSWVEGSESVGPLRQFYLLAAWCVFLLLGGHRAVVGALLSGQDALGTVAFSEAGLRELMQLLGGACGAALQLAGPLLAALLAARIASAWLARLLPEFPGESLAGIVIGIFGLVLVMAGLPSMVPAIEQFIRAAV